MLLVATPAVEDAVAVAKRALERLRLTIEEDGVSAEPSATIGVAQAPTHATEVEQLLAMADAALYDGKEQGRRCVITPWAPPQNPSRTTPAVPELPD